MGSNNKILAATALRPRLPPRPIDQLYKLPPEALVTAAEAELVTQLTKTALAVRRSKGQWPPFDKIGRLVRYRLGSLLTAPDPPPVRDRNARRATTSPSTI
jgi:hypothetical protein